MRSPATTVDDYLADLSLEDRREIEAVRRVILQNLPKGYEETIDFGMLSYVVPFQALPDTYNGHPLPYVALAAQKNHRSLYLMNVYGDAATGRWFRQAYEASGKRLDMGKSCVRFKRAEDLPLDVIGQAVARTPMKDYVAAYRRVKGAGK